MARTADPIVLHGVESQPEPGSCTKPVGFWYEVNGDWRRWARGESFTIGTFLHDVRLDGENILEIRSVEALDAFHARYGVACRHWKWDEKDSIDWRRVAERFDGVEIAPYLWERRLDLVVRWYYTWDCASGVIWRPKSATVSYRRELRERRKELEAVS